MSQSPIYDNYEELHKYVLRALVSITKKHPDDVYDYVTDALMKGHEKFHMFDPTRSQLKSWLVSIARNEFLQGFKKHKNDRHEFVDFNDQMSHNDYNKYILYAMHKASNEELVEDVNPVRDGNVTDTLMSTKWVNKNPLRRAAFDKIVKGISPDVVADEMGIPRTTVRVWVSRAYDEVRAAYGISKDTRNLIVEKKITMEELINKTAADLKARGVKVTLNKIAKEANVSRQSVWKHWADYVPKKTEKTGISSTEKDI